MVGKVGDVAQALAALQQARAELLAQLESEPAWQAMRQLDAREANGDPVAAIDAQALRSRLAARLDVAAPAWRSMQGLETAIAALVATPLAKLPSAGVLETSCSPKPTARPSPSVAGSRPDQGQQQQPPRVRPTFLPGSRPPPNLIAGPSTEARDRTLAEAIAAMQALAASDNSPATTNVQRTADLKSTPPIIGDDDNPRTVLGRIRSVEGDRMASAPEPGHRASAADIAHVRSLPFRTGPPPGNEAAPAASPALPIDASVRIASVEQELDDLMRNSIAGRSLSPLAEDHGTEGVDDLDIDNALVEEAEIEIVSSDAHDAGQLPTTSASRALSAAGKGRERAERSSWVPKMGERETSPTPGGNAAYDGIIDEASVEIVLLDDARVTGADQPKTATGNPKTSTGKPPQDRRHRDD